MLEEPNLCFTAEKCCESESDEANMSELTGPDENEIVNQSLFADEPGMPVRYNAYIQTAPVVFFKNNRDYGKYEKCRKGIY